MRWLTRDDKSTITDIRFHDVADAAHAEGKELQSMISIARYLNTSRHRASI